jgi:hypothetical protein
VDRRIALQFVLSTLLGAATVHGQPESTVDREFLARVGRYVEAYFERTGTMLSREAVRLQPLLQDRHPAGMGRQLVYERRITRTAAASGRPTVTVERVPLRTAGKIEAARDEPDCFDPRADESEPLAMLLPERQIELVFTGQSTERLDRRPALAVAFRPASNDPPTISWKGGCGNVDLAGRVRGRFWADSQTGTVWRLDVRLEGSVPYLLPIDRIPAGSMPPFQSIEHFETSVRYQPVAFRNPDETVVLPSSIRIRTQIYNGGVPNLLTIHSFTDYKRFLGDARIVK